MGIDDEGPRPDQLAHALEAGVGAIVVTPGPAQNPTGAALTQARGRDLRRVLARHRETLVIEDDHAGPVAGAPARSVIAGNRPRWSVIRSMSKSSGPTCGWRRSPVTPRRLRASRDGGWWAPDGVSGILQEVVAHCVRMRRPRGTVA